MVSVVEVTSAQVWNDQLKKTRNGNVFSCFEWGEYKAGGWSPLRLAVFDEGKFLGQAQLLLKKKFKFALAWVSGGVNVVDSKHYPVVLHALSEYFKGLRHLVRLYFPEKHDSVAAFLIGHEARPAWRCVNSGFSIIHDLGNPVPAKLSSNHRYYQKKAVGNQLTFKFGAEVGLEDFASIHDEMVRLKNVDGISTSTESLMALAGTLGEKCFPCLVLKNNQPVAGCLILRWAHTAFYYMAASSAAGRDLYASYAMVPALLENLRATGVTEFNFGGITPYDPTAAGVNRFKLGFGGEQMRALGEWDLTNSEMLQTAFNVIYLRR